MYTIQRAKEVVETIKLKENEQLEVLKVRELTDSVCVDLRYTNKRCNHIYHLHITEKPNGMYGLSTIIKNDLTGKDVMRLSNSILIADKLIFAFSTDIRKKFDKNAYPDLEEIKRFIKYQYPDELLCMQLADEWLTNSNVYLDAAISPSMPDRTMNRVVIGSLGEGKASFGNVPEIVRL